MVKISKILDMAASKLGIVNSGEALRPEDADLFLTQLKFDLYEMSIRYFGAKCYDETVNGKNPILLGHSQDMSVLGDISARPALIDSIQITRNDISYKLPIRTYKDFLNLNYTDVAGIPNQCYVKNDFDFYSLYFYPNCQTSDIVRIFGRSYMCTDDLSYSDYLEIPDEYLKGIYYNLALSMSDHYGVNAGTNQTGGLYVQAKEAMKHIREKMMLENIVTPDNEFSRTTYSKHVFFNNGF